MTKYLRESLFVARPSSITPEDFFLLLSFVSRKSKEYLIAHPEHLFSESIYQKFSALLERRSNHEPIAFITGFKEFYGFHFFVNPATLIPRPETEDMVSLAIESAPQNGKLHDVGTGSGAIAIAIKHSRSDLQVSASDISRTALKIARININNYSFDDIKLYETNLMDDISEKFDIVTANLPYIPSDRSFKNTPVAHEPDTALYNGEDGLDHYKELFNIISQYLNPSGTLLIEAEPDQHQALIELARQYKLELDQQVRLTLSFRQVSD